MKSKAKIDIDWTYHEKQADVIQALKGPYDLIVFRTGYGGGKSVLGARWVLKSAIQYPNSDNLCMAQDRQKGKSTTFRVLFDELPPKDANTNPHKGGDPTNSDIIEDFNASDLRLTTVTDSVIRLGGADRWNRYAGGEFSTIWCDEPSHYENTDLYDLYEMLISRQRAPTGPNKMLWTSTGNGYNQFFDITEKQINQQGDPLQWKDRMKVVTGSSKDNPWLEELDKLIQTFGGTEREAQAIEGGFAQPQGLVYDKFSREQHVIEHQDYDVERYIYGYDAGMTNPRVFLKIAVTPDDRYIIEKEFYRSDWLLSDAVEEFDKKMYDAGTLYADPSAKADIEEMKSEGIKAKAGDNDVDGGISKVQSIISDNRLKIHRSCRNTINEFHSYRWDENKDQPLKKMDHALDGLRYALYTEEKRGSVSSGGFVVTDL